MEVIRFENVWEMYRIPFVVDKRTEWENFWALRDISFYVSKGQTVGIIGKNGSGKSTILKLIAGILKSDRGRVITEGRVSGLLELGAGFQMELTGKENVYLNVGLFGLKPVQIDKIYGKIVDFAGIGKFMDAPVKCYSSGMFMRLAFAIAIQIDPDILLVDDTLAVGDEDAQRQCIRRIFELKEQGKTIVLVTHDMCLASTLCDKLIFIEYGRIVSQGSAKAIIGQYMEMVGDKNGIGVLQSGSLRAVFNNGKIILSWDNNPLTKGLGIHSSVSIANKIYDSMQADWKVEIKKDSPELTATGIWRRVPIRQVWNVKIDSGGRIIWGIEMTLEEDISIEQIQTCIMLSENYSEWFTLKTKGCFYKILPNDKDWEEFYHCSPIKNCLGVEDATSDGQILPPVLFESLDNNSADIAAVLNSDYVNNARVLRFSKFEHNVLPKGRSIFFTRRISFDKSILDQYSKEKQYRPCIENGKLKLIFDEDNIKIFWNNLILTKGFGIRSSLLCDNIWHHSYQANWIIEIDRNILHVKMKWERIPITQTWEFDLKNKNCIQWSVKTDIPQKLNISMQRVDILLTDKYKNWITSDSCGTCPDNFHESWIDMVQGNVRHGFLCIEGFKDEKSILPSILFFQDEYKNAGNAMRFYSSGSDLMGRVIQLHSSLDIKASDLSKDTKNHCLSGRILICEPQQKISKYADINLIDKYPLRFLFQNGSGHLFWKGAEITKGLCLYTSIRSSNIWNDSCQADWKSTEQNTDSLLLEGKWRSLPILQVWQFKLAGENTINWKIYMEVFQQIAVDRRQTNIMLSEDYSDWMAIDCVKGKFTSFKTDIDSDWERLWSGKAKKGISALSVKKGRQLLPKVTLASTCEGRIMNIVNSDIYVSGRILQDLNKNKELLLPGRYDYFSGSITLSEAK